MLLEAECQLEMACLCMNNRNILKLSLYITHTVINAVKIEDKVAGEELSYLSD